MLQKDFSFLLTFSFAVIYSKEVCTPLGKIHGYLKTSHDGKKYSAFEGIPFAKPPTGHRRFEIPEPIEPWNTILQATSPVECCQIDMINRTIITGLEDCLYLNVYVPRELPNSEDNLDVIVHIHGGSFLYGSGHKYTNPTFLMDKNVILVTFNYRLGIFGFLSTEDDTVSGNNGLKDQVMALKWVQNNIGSFGGNPDSVTLTGLSAGGASVHFHYLSDMSKGLFHKGFSQSGVALNPWAIQEEPLQKARILARGLDCPIETNEMMVECLKKKSFEEILERMSLFFDYMFMPFVPFGPVVEKGSESFLNDYPYKLLVQGSVLDLPWIVSSTSHEGLFPTKLLENDLDNINENWKNLAPILLDFNYTLDHLQWTKIAKDIKRFYLGNVKKFDKENILTLVKIFSDRHVLLGTEAAIRLQSKINKSPIYCYIFSYIGDDNKDKGVGHGDDKKYFFDNDLDSERLSFNELKMKDVILDMLSSFAKDSNPIIEGVNWEPTTLNNLKCLNFYNFKVEDIKLETKEELAPTEFWKSIKFLENENLVITANDHPSVKIPNLGNIEGSYGQSLNGHTFYSFEGVPYAKPPMGKLRFEEPSPIQPWKGTWKAKTIYKCMQYYQYTPPGQDFIVGDEDCLYLNIYTPNLDQNANLDVIVFIHGGCFQFNYGGFQGPDYIMDKNVVYVNMNYRLGPLGFLSTENDIVPGNNGMKDQILALKWIKDNVKYFGGNPDSITISGMSAGGASVHFHYISPKSRGLFNRGISQSGTMFNAWVLTEKPLEKAKKLASNLGCTTSDLKKMVECLKLRPGRQIVASVKDFQPWLYNPYAPFGVVVDNWASDPLLPQHPYVLMKKKRVADLPWISSYTSSEGLYPASDFYIDEQHLLDIDTKWNDLMPFILDYNYTVDPQVRDEVSRKIRSYYMKDQQVSRSTFEDFVKITSDRVFLLDIQKATKLQASVMEAPVYSYFFTYRGAHSRSESRSGSRKDFGAAHGDDTCYVFKTNVDTTTTEEDRAMIELLVNIFTSFAKSGKPEVPVEWLPLYKDVNRPLVHLRIESPKKLTVEEANPGNAEFWDSLPLRENEKLFVNYKDEL